MIQLDTGCCSFFFNNGGGGEEKKGGRGRGIWQTKERWMSTLLEIHFHDSLSFWLTKFCFNLKINMQISCI